MDARNRDRRPHVDDGRHASILGRSPLVVLAAVILGLAGIALTTYRLSASPGKAGDSLGDLLTSAAMLFACAGFIAAALRTSGDARRSWSWLAAGGIIYLLGELTWAVEVAVGPEPSGQLPRRHLLARCASSPVLRAADPGAREHAGLGPG